jgi:hypothetical protein
LPANDPCTCELGEGWRIPTVDEWSSEIAFNGWANWNGPFNSVLKLHASGLILPDGFSYQVGESGRYWSSNQFDIHEGNYLDFYVLECSTYNNSKASGFAIRCVKNVNVKIEYTIDGGSNWLLIADNVPYNIGSYSWTVPSELSSSLAMIKITSLYDNVTFDTRDNYFYISVDQKITSARNLNISNISITPNPVNENTNVIFGELQYNKNIEICDINGRVINEFSITSNSANIDFSYLPTGVYFMKVYSEKGISIIKFMK